MTFPSWLDFLGEQGAQCENGAVLHFGDVRAERLAARDGTVLCPLTQFGVLRISGEDAPAFLNNMLSNDVNALAPLQAQLSSFNTAKGRVLATFTVCRLADALLLLMARDLTAAIQKKLALYVLRSKVKIEDVSDALICLGLSGPAAAAALQACFPAVPEAPLTLGQADDAHLLRLGPQRFLVLAAPERARACWPALARSARPAGAACWDWLDIRDGVARVAAATQEAFVLQMLNLDVTGGVSFKKGCYPGQEVVARMHYLGHAKRRMLPAHLAGDTLPAPGTPLFSADKGEQSCGEVVLASESPEEGIDLLAVVDLESAATGTVHLGSLQGPMLHFTPPPYALP